MYRRIGFLVFGAILATVAGCDGGGGLSGRGESCRWRNDCQGGLACVNNICTLNDFNVAMTAKSCDLIECTADGDCCGELPSFCVDLQAQCEAGDTFACSQFDDNCVCNDACVENRCVFRCTTDSDCVGGTCAGGTCVDCTTDDDCFGDQVCDTGSCVSGCSSTRDCPYLHACQEGRCVETGCTNARECIALTGNPRALCVDAECTSPCTNDAECNGGSYRFQDCIDGSCVYVGCETDEECRIFLDVSPGSSSSAVCRE